MFVHKDLISFLIISWNVLKFMTEINEDLILSLSHLYVLKYAFDLLVFINMVPVNSAARSPGSDPGFCFDWVMLNNRRLILNSNLSFSAYCQRTFPSQPNLLL